MGEFKEQNFHSSEQSGDKEEGRKLAKEGELTENDLKNSLSDEESLSERIVKNPEFGVVYEEKIVRLPEHRKSETGISQIRRKEILDLPGVYSFEEYYKKEGFEKTAKLLGFMTEESFPSYRTWNHSMFADSSFIANRGFKRFKSEGLFFQRIIPKERLDLKMNTYGEEVSPFFMKKNGELVVDDSFPEWHSNSLIEYDLSVSVSDQIWNPGSGPIFIFGGKNKAFAEYINSITTNPETRRMLELKKWNTTKPVTLLPTSLPAVLEGRPTAWNKDKIVYIAKKDYLPYPPGVKGDGPYFNYEDNVDWKNLSGEAWRISDENGAILRQAEKSVDSLINLTRAIPVNYIKHPLLPIIQHPDVRSLRWCHSDVGLVQTDKSTNVLFFETEANS